MAGRLGGKYINGFFVPKNPHKYVGKGNIVYRSSWEWAFMNFLDNNDSILQWASESVHIPYRNPFTGKNTIYVPDFLMVYVDGSGQQHVELIEIKPSKETSIEEAKSMRDKAHVALNMAKWSAANAWCKRQGIKFRVITENQIFQQGKKR